MSFLIPNRNETSSENMTRHQQQCITSSIRNRIIKLVTSCRFHESHSDLDLRNPHFFFRFTEL